MLKRNEEVNVHGFLVGIELNDGVAIDSIMNHIADGVRYMEGVGDTDINYLGQIEIIDGMNVMVKETEKVSEVNFQDEVDALNQEAGRKGSN